MDSKINLINRIHSLQRQSQMASIAGMEIAARQLLDLAKTLEELLLNGTNIIWKI